MPYYVKFGSNTSNYVSVVCHRPFHPAYILARPRLYIIR